MKIFRNGPAMVLLSMCIHFLSHAQEVANNINPEPPVIGLCIAAPSPASLDRFLHFMEHGLAPGGVNTLVLRVDFSYQYTSYPNLSGRGALSRKDVKQIVKTARKTGIRLIPQINLLGHQSWHSNMGRLLEEYPQFDENPSVKLPEKYEWPNEDGLYCKSYCPLHPEVHDIVFALVDEIMEVFDADAFHAGMDEVFYIGEEECPRCGGRDKAELFAGEVNLVRDHLASKGQELWIWGDRLLDGHTAGLGMWEASENGTHGAIDLVRKDVVICDWHYERADPTAAYFALKGFRVITCPWNRPEVTREQLEMLSFFRENSSDRTRDRYFGFMQTVWSPAERFLDRYDEYIKAGDPGISGLNAGEPVENPQQDPGNETDGQVGSFMEMVRFYRGGE